MTSCIIRKKIQYWNTSPLAKICHLSITETKFWKGRYLGYFLSINTDSQSWSSFKNMIKSNSRHLKNKTQTPHDSIPTLCLLQDKDMLSITYNPSELALHKLQDLRLCSYHFTEQEVFACIYITYTFAETYLPLLLHLLLLLNLPWMLNT